MSAGRAFKRPDSSFITACNSRPACYHRLLWSHHAPADSLSLPALPRPSCPPNNTTSCSKAAASSIPRLGSTPSATSASATERSPVSPRRRSADDASSTPPASSSHPALSTCTSTGRTLASQRVKAFDGVTTALEMEIGAPDVAQFLEAQERPFAYPLRHHRQPGGGAGTGFRRASDLGSQARMPEFLRFFPRADPPRISPPLPSRSSAFSNVCATNSTRAHSASAWAFSTLPEPRASK